MRHWTRARIGPSSPNTSVQLCVEHVSTILGTACSLAAVAMIGLSFGSIPVPFLDILEFIEFVA